jgi:cytoskeletal protein CcmA (bactofilin family)
LVSNVTGTASFAHNSSQTNGLRAGSDGTVNLIGSAIGFTGPVTATAAVTVSGALTVTGAVNATGGGVLGAAGYGVVLAGLVVVNRAPGVGDTHPNGTIWIQN